VHFAFSIVCKVKDTT